MPPLIHTRGTKLHRPPEWIRRKPPMPARIEPPLRVPFQNRLRDLFPASGASSKKDKTRHMPTNAPRDHTIHICVFSNRPWMLHVRRQRKCVILFAQDPVLTSPAEANAETLPCIGSPARVGVAAAITRDVVIRPVAALSGSIRQVLNISALGSGLTDF